jgi:hypothetical protein
MRKSGDAHSVQRRRRCGAGAGAGGPGRLTGSLAAARIPTGLHRTFALVLEKGLLVSSFSSSYNTLVLELEIIYVALGWINSSGSIYGLPLIFSKLVDVISIDLHVSLLID